MNEEIPENKEDLESNNANDILKSFSPKNGGTKLKKASITTIIKGKPLPLINYTRGCD